MSLIITRLGTNLQLCADFQRLPRFQALLVPVLPHNSSRTQMVKCSDVMPSPVCLQVSWQPQVVTTEDPDTGVMQLKLSNGIGVNFRRSVNEPQSAMFRLIASGGRACEGAPHSHSLAILPHLHLSMTFRHTARRARCRSLCDCYCRQGAVRSDWMVMRLTGVR